MGGRARLADLARRVHQTGWTGPLCEELLHMVECEPAEPGATVREAAARIVELYRRRRLLEVLVRMEAGVRSEAIDHAFATNELARYVRRSSR